MNSYRQNRPFVAIACGGTGGHLFPGLAVADQLRQRGCDVALLISPKDVDQQAVKATLKSQALPRSGQPDEAENTGVMPGAPMEIFTLPAVALQNGNYLSFARTFVKSYFAARKVFQRRRPDAVLAMGGFTSAPPVFAAKFSGVKTFLHESNTIPGRANRLLARFVHTAFIGFPETANRLCAKKILVTGTPVRPQFSPASHVQHPAPDCRRTLGLDPVPPTILVVGGSQGAHGLNEMILSALPLLRNRGWQWLHLTGANDFGTVKSAYAANKIKAVVRPFLAEMDLALGAATVAVSRAGASSLAEMAAMRLPSLLVPLPTAVDNHQFFNAQSLEKTGAARLLEQNDSVPGKIAEMLADLVGDESGRQIIQAALAQWYAPQSAFRIAENILAASWSSSCRVPAAEQLKPELQPTGGPNCHRSA